MTISTSIWCAQHPDAGQIIQQMIFDWTVKCGGWHDSNPNCKSWLIVQKRANKKVTAKSISDKNTCCMQWSFAIVLKIDC